MLRRFQQIDAFGAEPFAGNPLAVVAGAEGLSTEEMQHLARWTNLSETAFLLPASSEEAESTVEAWFGNAAERPERGFTRPDLEKDVREEHITFSWLLESMFERTGSRIRDASHDASRVFSAYTCIKTG